MDNKIYLCIDLKSFYASVECVERKLDPLTANLVVADPERGDKTICLAITPSMKSLGIPNRCRVFEIPKSVKYFMAQPRMQLYINYSSEIYAIYLKYLSKEDIYVYSIDEAFFDITNYMSMYQMSAKELAVKIMADVKNQTGITATAGIGTNLYLAKIALDITAKHVKDNIGYLTEEIYLQTLWKHKPITDFWRIGKGTSRKLNSIGILTMEDVAHANEDLLYRIFGIDAELLIDHSWGRETTTMADIKAYKPESSSVSCGQVLARDYSYEECRLIIKEMTDSLCLDMADKGVVTGSITLALGYSNKLQLKPAHGTAALPANANTYGTIIPFVLELYNRIVNPIYSIRRLNISANNVMKEDYYQYNLLIDPQEIAREKRLQKAALDIKKQFGGNAIVRGMDLDASGTTRERNRQIGGHKSGS